jgi:hypothetical protein
MDCFMRDDFDTALDRDEWDVDPEVAGVVYSDAH